MSKPPHEAPDGHFWLSRSDNNHEPTCEFVMIRLSTRPTSDECVGYLAELGVAPTDTEIEAMRQIIVGEAMFRDRYCRH